MGPQTGSKRRLEMLEELPRRMVSGVVWGLALSLVLKVTQAQDGRSALRPLAKTAMRGVVLATEKLRAVAEEAKETIDDIYAETQAEQRSTEAREYGAAYEDEAIPLEIDPPPAPTVTGSGEERYGQNP
jgi:hypothetical protein